MFPFSPVVSRPIFVISRRFLFTLSRNYLVHFTCVIIIYISIIGTEACLSGSDPHTTFRSAYSFSHSIFLLDLSTDAYPSCFVSLSDIHSIFYSIFHSIFHSLYTSIPTFRSIHTLPSIVLLLSQSIPIYFQVLTPFILTLCPVLLLVVASTLVSISRLAYFSRSRACR